MTRRELQWIKYDVSLPGAAGPHLRWLTTSDIAAAAAAEPAAYVEVQLEIPDLRAYPTPREKAAVLLETAAEVEHALMVQYLYAGYSLKDPNRDGVTDAAQKKVLSSWPKTLRLIARQEMGHLMTVENLLIFLDLPLHFGREDAEPCDDNLHPFPLKLQPLTRKSLAKYVVAESPTDAEGIDDIVDIAEIKAGWINRVGILYALLGLVFARQDQIDTGATGEPNWDTVVRCISVAAYCQDDEREHWHLAETDLHPETVEHQADPEHWNFGDVHVDRVATRAAALEAIRFIGVQGEGPSTGDERSHFDRFLAIFRGDDELIAFPDPQVWTPARPVHTNPKAEDFALERTKNWAKLGDTRYGLLLGFVNHYLVASGGVRDTLLEWIFEEMKPQVGFIARELTSRSASLNAISPHCAGMPFKLPKPLSLPNGETARWRIHRRRTEEAMAITTALLATGELDPQAAHLTELMASDQTRLDKITGMEEHPERSFATTTADTGKRRENR
jgi:hypothetical protein